jgi:four helix bundle protein
MAAAEAAISPEQLRDRTKTFANRIIRLFVALPSKQPVAQVIGKQLLRAGTSVGANYRAACRGRSRAEFISKLGVVVEEADETIYWLELLADNGIVTPRRLGDLLREAHELTAIFTAAQNTSKAR